MILHPNSIYFVLFILLTQSGIASVADNIAEIPRFTDPAVENDSAFGFELSPISHLEKDEQVPSFRHSTDLNYLIVETLNPRDYLAVYHGSTLTSIDSFSALAFTSFDAYQIEDQRVNTIILIGGYTFLSKPCPNFPDFHTGYAFLRIEYDHSDQLLDCEMISQSDNQYGSLDEDNRTIIYGGKILHANASSQLIQGAFLSPYTNQFGARFFDLDWFFFTPLVSGFDVESPLATFSPRPISCQNGEGAIHSERYYNRDIGAILYDNTFISYSAGNIGQVQLNTTVRVLACFDQIAVILSTDREIQFLNLTTMSIRTPNQWHDYYAYVDAHLNESHLSLSFVNNTGGDCTLNFVDFNLATGDSIRRFIQHESPYYQEGKCPGISGDLIDFRGTTSLIYDNQEFQFRTLDGRELMPSSGAFGLLTMGIDSDSDGVGDASDRCPNSNRDRCLLGILT